MSGPRIAFLRMADFPHPNRLLPLELERWLGPGSVEVFDVEAAVRRDRLGMLVNVLFVVWEHGLDLLCGRVRPWRAWFTTTWMFRRMSRRARSFVARGDFDASLQIQSLFDARAPGMPHFVYTDHTHLANLAYPDFDRRTLLGAAWIELETRLYREASRVFTRSGNIDRSLIEQYGCSEQAICRVGAGANVESRVREADLHHDDPPMILFVGMDWERKGGPELLAAFDRVRSSLPELELVVVGCSPAIEQPGVRVVGRLPMEALHACYERATVFCLPTRREPYGIAFVEAMHFGLPVVGTRVGAVPEIVVEGESGTLVDVGDVAGLAEALAKLLADPGARRSMGERARERARGELTWRTVARRIADAMDLKAGRGAEPAPRTNDPKGVQ